MATETQTEVLSAQIPAGFAAVQRDAFFLVICQQNVTPRPRGKHPYVSEWLTPAGELRGWSHEGVYALPSLSSGDRA